MASIKTKTTVTRGYRRKNEDDVKTSRKTTRKVKTVRTIRKYER